MKYGESSKIVTFYTRRFGKLSAIARGARRSASKYGSALEPMSHNSIVVYKKEERTLQTLSQCDAINSFRHLCEDIQKMSIGISIIELITRIAHEEEENAPLFALLVDALDTLDSATKNLQNVFYSFDIRFLKISGFQPSFGECAGCSAPLAGDNFVGEEVQFHIGKGGPLCRSCAGITGRKIALPRKALEALEGLSASRSLRASLDIDMDKRLRKDIETFLASYLRYHVSGMSDLKSEKVFSKILTPT